MQLEIMTYTINIHVYEQYIAEKLNNDSQQINVQKVRKLMGQKNHSYLVPSFKYIN